MGLPGPVRPMSRTRLALHLLPIALLALAGAAAALPVNPPVPVPVAPLSPVCSGGTEAVYVDLPGTTNWGVCFLTYVENGFQHAFFTGIAVGHDAAPLAPVRVGATWSESQSQIPSTGDQQTFVGAGAVQAWGPAGVELGHGAALLYQNHSPAQTYNFAGGTTMLDAGVGPRAQLRYHLEQWNRAGSSDLTLATVGASLDGSPAAQAQGFQSSQSETQCATALVLTGAAGTTIVPLPCPRRVPMAPLAPDLVPDL